MPMATPELAAKFDDEGEAWAVLNALGWRMEGARIIAPTPHYLPSEGRESDAVDYLCDEWDYAWIEDSCAWCGGLKEIRNPTGKCDHLCWPDNLTDEAKVANGYRQVTQTVWTS